jgi:catechol 2,3-dioxygenase-like lactoylglutathione lyase family enzyme
VIDHVGFEVSELARAAAFYDAVFHPLGARRLHTSEHAVAYGTELPKFWIVSRGRAPAPGYGHVALTASGRPAVDAAYAAGLANGGHEDDPPASRPAYGATYYSGYMRDPDGLRVEVVSGSG